MVESLGNPETDGEDPSTQPTPMGKECHCIIAGLYLSSELATQNKAGME